MKRKILSFLLVIAISVSLFSSCQLLFGESFEPIISLSDIPEFDGKKPFVTINGNVPFFDGEKTDRSYESYSALDELGRCRSAIACIGVDIMPTEERGSISAVKPTGWQTVKYDIVDGNYLYNRCHLIGFQLTGENANEKNLITGTRYMNVDGMLPFENMVADYVTETKNHVLYRVTPMYDGSNLLANGVLIEARSVEDGGEEIEFCVYVYNVQPGIDINYANGESSLKKGSVPEDNGTENGNTGTENPVIIIYILNLSSKKYHLETCAYAQTIKDENRDSFIGDKSELEKDGYTPCKTCKP